MFRLDRMGTPQLAGARFVERPVPGGDAVAFVAEAFRGVQRSFQAVLKVTAAPDEAERAARGFDGSLEHLGDGTSRMVLQADSVRMACCDDRHVGFEPADRH